MKRILKITLAAVVAICLIAVAKRLRPVGDAPFEDL